MNVFTKSLWTKWLMVAFVFSVSTVGCSREDEVAPAAPAQVASPGVSNDSGGSARLNFGTVYVLDARFSRETCWTGPGVCFKDGFGNIWDYAFVDNSNDPDVGPIGVELAGDQLRLSFYRSLEEDVFVVSEDVKVNEKLARALGKAAIVIKAGEYAVSHDTHKFGDALVDIETGR